MRESCLYRAQSRVRVLGRLAGRLNIGAHLLRALAQELGQEAEQRYAEGQRNDAEVDELEGPCHGIHRKVQRLGRRLHDCGMPKLDGFVFFLGGLRLGPIVRLRLLSGDSRGLSRCSLFLCSHTEGRNRHSGSQHR